MINDICVEAFLTLLADQHNLVFDEINLSLSGANKRGQEKDILSIDIEFTNDDRIKIHELALSRDGLFHSLPERLLIPKVKKQGVSDSEAAEKISQQIEGWKKFFAPFELAMLHATTQFFSISDISHVRILEALKIFWGLNYQENILEDSMLRRLLLVLPLSNSAYKDLKLCSKCFTAVLGDQIDLEWHTPQEQSIEDTLLPGLGEVTLGSNFCLGHSTSDGIPSILIRIKLVPYSNISSYFPKGRKRRIIEEVLSSYFLPLDTQKVITLEPELGADTAFTLTADGFTSILGYSTIIS